MSHKRNSGLWPSNENMTKLTTWKWH